MARVIKFTKVGKSTIVDVTSSSTSATQTYVINKPTDVVLRDDVLSFEVNCFHFNVQYEEIFDKLGAANLRDYVTAAATALLFTNN